MARIGDQSRLAPEEQKRGQVHLSRPEKWTCPLLLSCGHGSRRHKVGPTRVGCDHCEFEAHHDVALPPSHREFLMRGNGGVLGSVRLFGVARSDRLDLGERVSEMRAEIEGMADGPVLPFASDWGGSYFCYDLRGPKDANGEYPVLYWDHEYSEEPDDRPNLWSRFAPD